MTEIVLVVAVVAVLAVAFFVLSRRGTGASPADAMQDGEMEEGVVSEPVPVAPTVRRGTIVEAELEQATVRSRISTPRWTTQFEPRAGTLDDAARLKLINDLGMLRAAWCVPLLERAYEEETGTANRNAAQLALARCREVNPV